MTSITYDRVLQALSRHVGAERGVRMTTLAREIVGPAAEEHHERHIRDLIQALRRNGVPVCATPGDGYYIAATDAELDATCEWLYGRALCSLEQIAAMKKISLPDLRGQLHLPT